MKHALALALLLLSAAPSFADDNAVAFQLYEQGRYAEAAEIFTVPMWKGVALYKSDQFWRAAEAFVRGDDANSLYNLGNCYAKLGYYELALQAYLGAAARAPDMADARANADIMRGLISRQDDGAQAGLQPQAKQIDEVKDDSQSEDGSSRSGDESGKPEEQRSASERDEKRSDSDRQGQTQSEEGKSGDGAERKQDEGQAGQSDVAGRQGDEPAADQASSGSKADAAKTDDQAVGARARLESEQATEQWLNRIQDEPAKFLKARIALEDRRRAAAGNSPPAGGSAW